MENLELKELCIYLDQERARATGDRDEGDGSSNGTVTGHEDGVVAMDTTHPMSSIAHTGCKIFQRFLIYMIMDTL